MPAPEAALDDPSFQRAYLAVRYFAGTRGDELSSGLGALTASADLFATRLASSERAERAQALALELERIVRCLDARGLG